MFSLAGLMFRLARVQTFTSLTREILFLPLEHKIRIFSPPCNILYIDWKTLYIVCSLHFTRRRSALYILPPTFMTMHIKQRPYKKYVEKKQATYLYCLHTHKPDLWFGFASKLMCRYTLHPPRPSEIFVLCDFQCLLSRPSPVPNNLRRYLGLPSVYSRILGPILSIKNRKHAI